jgi:hypothetical protein
METIAHRMMDLHGERQQHFSILFVVFSKREHRGKEVLHVRNVHIKVRKRYPGIDDTKKTFSRDSSLGQYERLFP